MYCHCIHCYCTYCSCVLLLYPLLLYLLFIVLVDLEYCILLLQYCSSGDSQMEVWVWGLETLELQHTLPLPTGEDVGALLATKGRVWAGVGNDVVVWGRGA